MSASFDPALWTPQRALAFARGLYLVAASDGIAPVELEFLSQFLALTGAPTELDALLSTPFDFTEARHALDSHWLRRLMVRACRVLAEIDGGPSEGERDALRAMALGLGVGERVALAAPDLQTPRPEAILDWISDQPIDWVSWDDEAQRATFWPFPGGDTPLAHGAKLMVARGQALVVGTPSGAMDVLSDGVHEATPATLPSLCAALGWTDGPVGVPLVFVSLGPSELLRWGSPDPIAVPAHAHSAETVPLRAFGRFSVRIVDAGRAMQRFCRGGPLSTEDFEARMRRLAAGRFAESLRALAQNEGLGADRLLAEANQVVDRVRPAIEKSFAEAGLNVRRFELESLTGPMEMELRTTSGSRVLGAGGFANATSGNSAPDSGMSCHRCLTNVPPTARFCAHCGAPQRKACQACAAEVNVRAKFCPQCGTAQSGT